MWELFIVRTFTDMKNFKFKVSFPKLVFDEYKIYMPANTEEEARAKVDEFLKKKGVVVEDCEIEFLGTDEE